MVWGVNYSLKKTKSYESFLIVTLNKDDLAYHLNEARKNLANELRIDGFRRGKVPVEIAKDKLNAKEVLSAAFDSAFKQSFSDVLAKEKMELIDVGNLEVKENSAVRLVYSVRLTVFPDFKLADYRNIRIRRNAVSVSREEVDKTLGFIRDSRKTDGAIPELTDDFAKGLGRFENLEQLKESVSEGLKKEKEMRESQRIQGLVLDKLAKGTKVEIPPALVEKQLDQLFFDLDADLHQQGLELGPYLAKIKKTSGDLRNEWKPKAELLVKKSLLMKEVAKKEGIKVEPAELKGKVDSFLGNFAALDEAQKNIDLQKLAVQLEQIILNQKVLAFLEKEAVKLN